MLHVTCRFAAQIGDPLRVPKRNSPVPSPEEPLILPLRLKSTAADAGFAPVDASIGATLVTVNEPLVIGGYASPHTKSKLSKPSIENPPAPKTQLSP